MKFAGLKPDVHDFDKDFGHYFKYDTFVYIMMLCFNDYDFYQIGVFVNPPSFSKVLINRY